MERLLCATKREEELQFIPVAVEMLAWILSRHQAAQSQLDRPGLFLPYSFGLTILAATFPILAQNL
jgi:hypothetical protein